MIQNQRNNFKSAYKSTTVLVTGGSGFIGSHLVDSLVNLGAHVTVLDKAQHIPYKNSQATYIQKDIEGSNLFKSNRFEYVFHLAARCDLNGRTISDYSVNYLGTLNLLEQLEKSSIKKFVFYSTQLVVGLFNETRFIDSSEPYKTNTIYGKSKIAGELVVKKYCKECQIPFSIVRPTSVYGPRGKTPYRELFLQIAKHQYFHLGKASNLVSMAYVGNLIDLTLLIGMSRKTLGSVYYGTDFHPYTMKEFADEASEFFNWKVSSIPLWIAWFIAYGLAPMKFIGLPVPLYPFRLKNIISNYAYDIQNAVEVGYNPKWSLEMGIKATLEWYVNNDSSFKQFKDDFPCLKCNSGKTVLRYQLVKDRLGTTNKLFNVYKCESCGITFTNINDIDDLSQLYPKNYLHSNIQNEKSLIQWYRFDQYDFDSQMMLKETGMTYENISSYLDIGCGTGERIEYAKLKGCKNSVGLDKFDHLDENARLSVVNSEITDYYPEFKFDVISLYHVLEHLKVPSKTLKHILRYQLTENGILVIQVPNFSSFERIIFGRRWFGLDIPRHIWHFEPSTLTDILFEAGFEVISVKEKNALLHPVTFASSLVSKADPQKIWQNTVHSNKFQNKLMMLLWVTLTLISIPFSILLSTFNSGTMLTVFAKKRRKY